MILIYPYKFQGCSNPTQNLSGVLMDPFSLLALASAAGFVFNKLTGALDGEERREFTYSKDYRKCTS